MLLVAFAQIQRKNADDTRPGEVVCSGTSHLGRKGGRSGDDVRPVSAVNAIPRLPVQRFAGPGRHVSSHVVKLQWGKGMPTNRSAGRTAATVG